jgi:hypothetical protein
MAEINGPWACDFGSEWPLCAAMAGPRKAKPLTAKGAEKIREGREENP